MGLGKWCGRGAGGLALFALDKPLAKPETSAETNGPVSFPTGPILHRIGFRSEFEPGFHAPDPGFVDEPGQVVEIDATDRRCVLGDVADKGRNVISISLVAKPQAPFEQMGILELDGLVQEEIDLRAIGPIGIGIDFAIADGNRIARGPVGNPARALRQAVPV